MPKGTPREIVNRFHQEILTTVKTPEYRAFIAKLGGVYVEDTPETYSAKYFGDIERLGRVIRDAKLTF